MDKDTRAALNTRRGGTAAMKSKKRQSGLQNPKERPSWASVL